MPIQSEKLTQTYSHDHQQCIEYAVDEAESVAREAHKKLSANSWNVLRTLLNAHQSFGAYEICEALAEQGVKLQATQVYRALDQLIGLGIAHRIECKNAFIACCSGAGCRDPQFLICSDCGNITEILDLSLTAVADVAAKRAGFALESVKVELHGICTPCQKVTAGA